ncbi:hypothetical protein CcCBS67573_g06977 [Chytriomyces confervae]|uniref:Transcription factor domain-containing protein n=1 Tax=Chytriomyces confervae TaxID=246404 RepID=A0A507F037_9FUNG|nr:hypothetical protein CcCBS67573_g06977 [Chytriomyces confervae]
MPVGACCEYLDKDLLRNDSPGSDSAVSLTSGKEHDNQESSVLRSILNADAIALLDHSLPSSTTHSMVDFDLTPTVHDFLLVKAMFETKMGANHRLALINVSHFLGTFFVQPPALRLAMCANAALLFRDELASEVMFAYYRRTRKAVSRSLDTPTLETIPALYFLATISTATGETAFSVALGKWAIQVIYTLNMHIDPTQLPNADQLSEFQIQERRKWYWVVAFWTKLQAIMGVTEPVCLPIDKVQLPDDSAALFPILIRIYDIIEAVKVAHARPPSSIEGIPASETCLNIHAKLTQLLTEIPAHRILLPNSSLAPHESYKVFTEQLSLPKVISKADVIVNTVNFFSAVSMLYRPKMFVLSQVSPLSTSVNAHILQDLIAALDKCVSSALHVVNVFKFLLLSTNDLTMPEGIHAPPHSENLPKLFDSGLFVWALAFNLFEAAIVLWCLACRVDSQWNALLPNVPSLQDVQADFQVISAFLDILGANLKGNVTVITPIIECVKAMKLDVDSVGLQPHSAAVDRVEIQMSVLALTEEGPDSEGSTAGEGGEVKKASDDLKVIQEDASPLAFMGLLGFEVLGGVRWKGAHENEWRQFWEHVQTTQ